MNFWFEYTVALKYRPVTEAEVWLHRLGIVCPAAVASNKYLFAVA